MPKPPPAPEAAPEPVVSTQPQPEVAPVPEPARNPGTADPLTTGAVKLLYKCAETNAAGNQIKPHFKLVNTSDHAVPLGELTIRYWFTCNGDKPLSHWCDYSGAGNTNVTATFSKVARRADADHCLEIGFTAAAGSLVKGKDIEIQSRSAKNDWSAFNQGKDYSFAPSLTNYAESPKVALYRNGSLVSGTEPR